mmetsp:Transcript_28894/g.33236  ORF Transcript_28894/g.33236 Transcript_28894/m.33236 type:complete len:353 (-) Transcript_28894:560-1618(-)
MVLLRVVSLLTFIVGGLIPLGIKITCHFEQSKWSIPSGSVSGKIAIVTGANSGLGLETARVLAKEGAQVVMACRSPSKCQSTKEEIQRDYPSANLRTMTLDLSNPDSIKTFSSQFLSSHTRLDLLVNNAAIMATKYSTVQWPGGNIETQFATNHLGPFLLTGLLQPILESTPGARIVNHSSSASDACKRTSTIAEIANASEKDYIAFLDSYACSKRANRFFTWSLNQRLKGGVMAVACHPGWTGTNLQHRATGIKASFMSDTIFKGLSAAMNGAYAQPVNLGVQPQLYAATSSSLGGGEVIGPRFVMFGSPVVETAGVCQLGPSEAAGSCKQTDLDSLWEESERLAGFTYKK